MVERTPIAFEARIVQETTPLKNDRRRLGSRIGALVRHGILTVDDISSHGLIDTESLSKKAYFMTQEKFDLLHALKGHTLSKKSKLLARKQKPQEITEPQETPPNPSLVAPPIPEGAVVFEQPRSEPRSTRKKPKPLPFWRGVAAAAFVAVNTLLGTIVFANEKDPSSPPQPDPKRSELVDPVVQKRASIVGSNLGIIQEITDKGAEQAAAELGLKKEQLRRSEVEAARLRNEELAARFANVLRVENRPGELTKALLDVNGYNDQVAKTSAIIKELHRTGFPKYNLPEPTTVDQLRKNMRFYLSSGKKTLVDEVVTLAVTNPHGVHHDIAATLEIAARVVHEYGNPPVGQSFFTRVLAAANENDVGGEPVIRQIALQRINADLDTLGDLSLRAEQFDYAVSTLANFTAYLQEEVDDPELRQAMSGLATEGSTYDSGTAREELYALGHARKIWKTELTARKFRDVFERYAPNAHGIADLKSRKDHLDDALAHLRPPSTRDYI